MGGNFITVDVESAKPKILCDRLKGTNFTPGINRENTMIKYVYFILLSINVSNLLSKSCFIPNFYP